MEFSVLKGTLIKSDSFNHLLIRHSEFWQEGGCLFSLTLISVSSLNHLLLYLVTTIKK